LRYQRSIIKLLFFQEKTVIFNSEQYENVSIIAFVHNFLVDPVKVVFFLNKKSFFPYEVIQAPQETNPDQIFVMQ
jgi:hypothetical protein